MHIQHVKYAMPNARNAQKKAKHMLQRSSHTKLQNELGFQEMGAILSPLGLYGGN
jgi:23S rRNA G2445 N2-methylase RlmL